MIEVLAGCDTVRLAQISGFDDYGKADRIAHRHLQTQMSRFRQQHRLDKDKDKDKDKGEWVERCPVGVVIPRVIWSWSTLFKYISYFFLRVNHVT